MADYIVVGISFKSGGATALPFTVTLDPITGIQPGDLLIVSVALQATFDGDITFGVLGGTNPAADVDCQGGVNFSDTLDGIGFTAGYENTGITTPGNPDGQQLFLSQQSWAFANGGDDTITAEIVPGPGAGSPPCTVPASCESYEVTAVVCRFGNLFTLGQSVGPPNFQALNVFNADLDHLVNEAGNGGAFEFEGAGPPFLVVATAFPGSGAATSPQIPGMVNEPDGMTSDGVCPIQENCFFQVPAATGILCFQYAGIFALQAYCLFTPDGTVGVGYSSQAIGFEGGVAPYTVAIIADELPPGLSIDDTGLVSGTPTTLGVFPWTAQVTDSIGATAQTRCQITIAAGASLSVSFNCAITVCE